MTKYVLNEKAKEFLREFFAEETAEEYIQKAETIFNCDQTNCSFLLPMSKDIYGIQSVSGLTVYLNRRECTDVIEE